MRFRTTLHVPTYIDAADEDDLRLQVAKIGDDIQGWVGVEVAEERIGYTYEGPASTDIRGGDLVRVEWLGVSS
jgi:hypothetical protein